MPVYSRLLAWTPKIRVSRDQIVATTSLWWQILFLGTFRRQVTVDSRIKRVELEGRFFWFFKSRRYLRFDEIDGVLYEYHETGGSMSYVTGESEGPDNYHVGLRLTSGERVPLFTFTGESEYIQQTRDFWEIPHGMMETITDTAGTQHEQSLEFIDLLCARLNVQLEL